MGSRFERYLVCIRSSFRAAKHHLFTLWLDAGCGILLHSTDHVMADCVLDLYIQILAVPMSLWCEKNDVRKINKNRKERI